MSGHSVLSHVCGEYSRLPQKHIAFGCSGRGFSRGGVPSEEGSATPEFSALRSPFIHPGDTWQAAEAQGPAELWLSLVA